MIYKQKIDKTMQDFQKQNYAKLQATIRVFKPNFTLEDAITCWHNIRKFRFKAEQQWILMPADTFHSEPFSYRLNEFVPLLDTEKINKILLDSGFYRVPVEFEVDWKQNKFYQKIFSDFFNQFVIDGNKPYGYYFFGNIGVGKTTLITAIAKVLIQFLYIELRYITMTRLVRLITSVDRDDRHLIAKLENCAVLFIDDLGIEKYTTDNQEAVLRDFFAYRNGNGLLNIISGNIDIRIQQKKNSFNRQISDYLNDSKYYKIFELTGKSKRI